eukprot:g3637.t1
MSEEGSFYTFNAHREALYRLLEATVRGEPGCLDAEGDARCPRNGGAGRTSAYPSPVLWYDEMRPSDIDAYHAANGRGRFGSDRDPGLEGSRVGSTTTPTTRDRSGEERSWSESRVGCRGSGAGDGRTACDREGRRTGVPGARQPAEQGALGEREAVDPPGSTSSTSSTPDLQRKCTFVSPQPPMSSTEPRGHSPHDNASGEAVSEEREEDGAAVASTGSSNAHDGRRRPRPLEENECQPIFTTPPETSTAITTTPPDPSQDTQTMFLPGLPSQVMVTQQQGEAGWEQPEGDDLSQKEDHAVASEYTPPPATHAPRPPAEEHVPSPEAIDSVASPGGKRPSSYGGTTNRPEPDGSKSYGPVDDPPAPGSEDREEEATSSHQNSGFTRALRGFLGEPDPAENGALTKAGSGSGSGSGDGGGVELFTKPLFRHVPTLEVLPSGWSGGQRGVVALLEDHLSHARARCPGGYAARALQLACHVLRQPTVCIRVTGNRWGGAATGGAATGNDDDHPEVVGIAGFVWGILRANGGDGSSPVATS